MTPGRVLAVLLAPAGLLLLATIVEPAATERTLGALWDLAATIFAIVLAVSVFYLAATQVKEARAKGGLEKWLFAIGLGGFGCFVVWAVLRSF